MLVPYNLPPAQLLTMKMRQKENQSYGGEVESKNHNKQTNHRLFSKET